MSHFQLALLLGMTVALGPLALDAYLPAFPAIAREFAIPHADVGLTLSAYVATLGMAQLVGGPLSDRYGRRNILFIGLAVFALASLMIALADNLSGMIAWRVVQGVGGAFCAVSVPAIVRDQVGGQEAARLFGLIGLIMFIAPAAAPSLGALMLALGDWHWIYVFLAAYAFFLAVVLQLALFPRLKPRPRTTTPVKTLVTNYVLVLKHHTTMRFVGIQVMCFSSMMLFITHSSFIYQEWFGLSNSTFSILFAANIGVMAVLNLINRPLLRTISSVVLLRVQVIIQFVMLVGLVSVVLLDGPLWAVAGFIIAAVGCQGGIVPNNMANALEFFPHMGGTAAAMLGASQFTLAGAISALSSAYGGEALLPITLSMLACSVGAVLLSLGAPAAVAREKAAEQSA
ncbi:MAG: multidrug effflux MFS transporter [Marinobacter sp.]|uniref:multidrug effflux MFS transporter n=1 Tax=Marinobacter sp. TaxID=50741 RepID=UPI0029C13071|nr:multidrug effflux MFS transporter [Marinobacter sp.]MDX5336611.1 multidrug effflux MFS transporter [Marinobacter sp.]MDX5387759.1 multidrug effflux MFS transporter [Marinobacter sp.]MDX5438919.1 multidrug effflux MFS transporter [Alteromonadaceae bacterium]MDX5473060.1 multidrug effflux MFS transporter [Marinobacter sp.]